MNHISYSTWDKIKKEEEQIKEHLQKKFCDTHNLPFLVSHCSKCGCHVLELYTLKECETRHITSCRRCNTSLVD